MSVLKKILLFSVPLYVILLSLILLGLAWFKGYGAASTINDQPASVSSSVMYLEKAEEVVFLNTGIQKVISKSEFTDLFGFKVPESKKTALIILRYKAKFGIKESVDIEEVKENSYVVTVPKFEVIGVEPDEKDPYELYDKSGELLSYSTKDVDTGKMVVEGLSSKNQREYLEYYEEYIKESAESYYNNIIKAINPEAKVTVEFE
ncbi:TPA: DUF4230 domain-containing protein [Streptococcus suis]|uniref:DUF4230 domain-containing protein n=1 Tax=Streptococcus suis TaxID=1307 RepID=UPI002118EB66|nr:DUF4230 domain-containing protein [Streptococcus suis]HEL1618224.1 DUF4230 domain-containing protein [Streptococcus suis]